MKKVEKKIAQDYAHVWRIRQDVGVNQVFQVYDVDNGGNSGYPNQWSRILGIDFGIIHTDFLKALKGNAEIHMNLGIRDNQFTVVFESTEGGESTYFMSSLKDDGRVFDIANMPARPFGRIYGISTELRNQLAYNWLVIPPSIIELFYSLAPKRGKGVPSDPVGNTSLVRVHHYLVVGKNREVLRQAFVNKDTRVSVRFGANLTDKNLNRDTFTLILEISNEVDTDSNTFLEFVQACPPFCGGGDG